jgi:hypothetical protein
LSRRSQFPDRQTHIHLSEFFVEAAIETQSHQAQLCFKESHQRAFLADILTRFANPRN